jgi:two-component system nitrogen regulation response regulator NtrX
MARVLVVDDDEPIRDTLRVLLEESNHIVYEASSGEAAIDILRNTPYRFVVLLDLIMPGLDGVAVLRAVSADSRLSLQHAYILVSAGGAGDIARAEPLLTTLQGRAVNKPFDMDTLLDAVEAAARQLI